MYKPTKVLENLSDTDNDSDDFNSSRPRKTDFREKHISASSRGVEKVIDTDNSSYEDIEEDEDIEDKADRAKPILTLAEEVRRIIMKTMVDNRQKLANYQKILSPVQQSRLEAMTKLSQHWSPQWSGDQNEDLYESQDLREKIGRPAPVPPLIKPKPGRPTKNRRKDKDEGGSGSKTRMKRKYKLIRCMFCGEVGHNKRTCKLKKQVDVEEEARLMQLQLAVVDPNTDAPNELSNDNAHAKVRGRPPKLQVSKGKGKRAISPQPAATTATIPISVGTIKGTSAATTKKIASFMTFVPTPGFKRPRKKDNAI
ncbi:hypothetical protein Ahy_A02g006310 [Arachis hypogaea]|uniref:CCHC-type domain-containing protein n=1 Tax=Arachis hypogaea TaxID=3818 RepID=A0A445E9K8_ARAHY|nr:hypothetical protein Ahy_A02g006310 [Arachis hypogaea]